MGKIGGQVGEETHAAKESVGYGPSFGDLDEGVLVTRGQKFT